MTVVLPLGRPFRCARAATIIAATALGGCSSYLHLTIQRLWSADEPVASIAMDAAGSLHAELSQPGEVQTLTLLLDDDLEALYVRPLPELLHYAPLVDCRVSAGQPEGELLTPARGWRASAFDTGRPIELEAETPPRELELRVTGCARIQRSCTVTIERVEAPPITGTLRSVAALPGRRMIASGVIGPTPEARYLYFDDSGVRELGPYDGLMYAGPSLVLRGDRVIGTAHDRLLELDLEGRYVGSSSIGFTAADLAIGADGSLAILGRLGELAIVRGGIDSIERLEPPPYGTLQDQETHIAMVSADRLLVIGPDLRLYLYEGGRWRPQLTNAEKFDEVGAGIDSFVVCPTRGTVQKKDGMGDWTSLGPATIRSGLNSAIPLSDGRFLFSGREGQLRYWNGEAMCEITTDTGKTIESLSLEPGTRTVWGVGENLAGPNSAPLVMRIEVPAE